MGGTYRPWGSHLSVVWSPFTARNITNLERVQRRATKFILKTEDDYEVRISKLTLLSLDHRRFLFDVLFFYKALNVRICPILL